jgi:hypothetical protein
MRTHHPAPAKYSCTRNRNNTSSGSAFNSDLLASLAASTTSSGVGLNPNPKNGFKLACARSPLIDVPAAVNSSVWPRAPLKGLALGCDCMAIPWESSLAIIG